MADNEKNIERRLRDEVTRLKGLCVKLLPFHMVGLPDRLVLLPGGKVIFVETKTRGKGLSPAQKRIKVKLEMLGFMYRKISTMYDMNLFLEHEVYPAFIPDSSN